MRPKTKVHEVTAEVAKDLVRNTEWVLDTDVDLSYLKLKYDIVNDLDFNVKSKQGYMFILTEPNFEILQNKNILMIKIESGL